MVRAHTRWSTTWKRDKHGETNGVQPIGIMAGGKGIQCRAKAHGKLGCQANRRHGWFKRKPSLTRCLVSAIGSARGGRTIVRTRQLPESTSKDVHRGVFTLPMVKKRECTDRVRVVLANALRSTTSTSTCFIAIMDMVVPADRLVGKGGDTCTLLACSHILHPRRPVGIPFAD